MSEPQSYAFPSRSPSQSLQGPAGAILLELKRAMPATARELAARSAMSLNATRHHLKELESDGLVCYDRLQRGVGAPVYAYRLTAAGEALFPRRYKELFEHLLDHVVEREGRAAAVAALESHFDVLAARLANELAGLPASDRMPVVVRALSGAGYMAEGTATFSCGTLVEHNCAIREVAERFPEVCAAEERFLATVLGGTVERKAHMLGGCSACEYKVSFPQESA